MPFPPPAAYGQQRAKLQAAQVLAGSLLIFIIVEHLLVAAIGVTLWLAS